MVEQEVAVGRLGDELDDLRSVGRQHGHADPVVLEDDGREPAIRPVVCDGRSPTEVGAGHARTSAATSVAASIAASISASPWVEETYQSPRGVAWIPLARRPSMNRACVLGSPEARSRTVRT